jgi:hypothetical protein
VHFASTENPLIWNVASAGYQIADYFDTDDIQAGRTPQTLRCLVPKGSLGTAYNPLEHPDLPMLFSGLLKQDGTISDSRILAFANKWGALGDDVAVSCVPTATGGRLTRLDSLIHWKHEIRAVARVLRIASLGVCAPKFGSSDPEKEAVKVSLNNLENHVKVSKQVMHWEDDFGSSGFEKAKYPWLWNGDATKRAVTLARLVLQNEINRKLKDKLTYTVTMSQTHFLEVGLVPKGLIGAIWYMTSEQIFKGNGYRQCKNCGIIFRPKHEDATTCQTNSCKSRIRRRNRKLEFYMENFPIDQP